MRMRSPSHPTAWYPLRLQPATFLRRYKRFLADVRLDNDQELTVHCPNPGSMRSLLTTEMPCWLRDDSNPKRKLSHTLVILATPDGGLAVVDTHLPNRLVAHAITENAISELTGYATCRPEQRYGQESSRIDLLLEDPHRPPCYVEIKNVTLLPETGPPGRATFPDAVSSRGARHLRELAHMAGQGCRAVQFYLLNRTDCDSCGIAADIDPGYATALQKAMTAGVEVLAYRSHVTPDGVALGERVTFDPS
jgi:sugar fermentation stimulation protein A